ncbi:MAG: hypothetical protein A2845_00780 [Candidatus Lloydbacteria bacterium RIFCSPHIGHO2_01_FULL_49_22]|uniref:Uncharacterized protein n=1 Tax=Candidatus Lloydbacteria bacterium RIFCSPHIGHO2_01_FULL_49_22 TaxID=1798658 RepID=A0A1G2D065_9BACT|nr:MAG: hypothetical protein A2845_00780 [Candidatus Lloydbacteria bacterium RIFCSPHIGHO2_01_FULL_49_22]OGZ09391.1 MAG: hypothetical protein A3C14_05685 [Candidatus Lloydbacteria bacterium RIFCSPHIGHO2_02_FULL_50_18]
MNKKILKYTLVIFGIFLLGGVALSIHLFIQSKFGVYAPLDRGFPVRTFHPTGISIDQPSI